MKVWQQVVYNVGSLFMNLGLICKATFFCQKLVLCQRWCLFLPRGGFTHFCWNFSKNEFSRAVNHVPSWRRPPYLRSRCCFEILLLRRYFAMQMHHCASPAVIVWRYLGRMIMASVIQSSPVLLCASAGNMPLSCAGPLADNGRVWGEHYHRDICSRCDNALLWKVRLNSSSHAHADKFLFPFFLSIYLCVRPCAYLQLQPSNIISSSITTNLCQSVSYCIW